MSSQTTAHGIEQWPIVKLIPYARNPRKNDHAVERMAASIREFGFKVPAPRLVESVVRPPNLNSACRLLKILTILKTH